MTDIDVLYDFNSQEFDPSVIDRPSIIVVIADQRVGKTTLCTDLLLALNASLHIDIAVATTTSEDPTYFANILDDALVFRNVDPAKTSDRLMHYQKGLQKKKEESVPRTAVVFDNVFFSSGDFKGMSQYFLNSRTANILSIFTTTDPSIMPKQLQDNADYVFIARSMRATTRKKCWQTFGDMFEDYKSFNSALYDLRRHSFLVVDKNSRSKDLMDIVSVYTPTVYLAQPISGQVANAYGKWHLLPGKMDEKSKSDIFNTFDPEMEDTDEVNVHDHVKFTIADDRIAVGFLTALGIE